MNYFLLIELKYHIRTNSKKNFDHNGLLTNKSRYRQKLIKSKIIYNIIYSYYFKNIAYKLLLPRRYKLYFYNLYENILILIYLICRLSVKRKLDIFIIDILIFDENNYYNI